MQKLKSLKLKLIALKKQVLSTMKTIIDSAVNVALVIVMCTVMLYVAVRAPDMHSYWLRHSVGSKVYLIKDNPRGGGGTGFAIKAPSGETYILTNDHVCSVSSDRQTVLVQNDYGLSMRRRILARADFTDLCLIEGIPGIEGLELGPAPTIGQIVAAVGHPSLMPITLSKGEIISQEDIMITEGPISFINPDTGKETLVPADSGGIALEQCSKVKNRQVEGFLDFGFFQIKVKYCVNLTEGAYRTNMLIQPGNSGSPIVDFWGNVVGVVFAGDRYMWGIDVKQQDVAKFLENY